ncbi:MAG: helix-turn-helix domain-containing protein [Adlercreutzia equolifaciens]
MRDNGEVIGQQTGARTLRDVSQAITTSIEPRVYATVEKLQADDDKTYIKVTFSGNERPCSCRGSPPHTCGRRGPSHEHGTAGKPHAGALEPP